jgi:hypothetical protein
MTFVMVQFDYPGHGGTYSKLLKALLFSISTSCPKAKVIARRIQPPIGMREKKCFASNTKKLDLWLEELEKSEDKEICFIDCDMVVMRDPSEIFQKDFDIAYTVRKSRKPPVNGGVIFIKKNERSIQTIRKFKEINDAMYRNKGLHDVYRKKYAGMNQAAWGYLLEHGGYDAKMIEIPCAIWNAVDEDWHAIDGNTKILHVKSVLRRACMEPHAPRERKLLKAWQIWQGYHKGKISIPDVDSSVTRNLKLGNEMFPTIRPKDSVRESSLKKKSRTFQHSRRDKDYVMVQIDKKKQENLKGESVEGFLDTLGRKAYQRLYVP